MVSVMLESCALENIINNIISIKIKFLNYYNLNKDFFFNLELTKF